VRPIRTLACILGALLICHAPAGSAAPASYAKRDDVRQFIETMVERHGFKKRQLESMFAKVQAQPTVLRSMALAPESGRSWQSYRAMFVNPQRIEAGVRFWNRYGQQLERASAEFGVPEEIIMGIMGVETTYGRNMGNYRVIDTLTTLAFDSPTRGEFFRGQLESYLLFTRESKIDVFKMKGSYAGAIGIPQFMPGSYRQFAVDYDGDGRANLAESPADAIGSVGNFLRAHGWERGQAVAVRAEVTGDNWRALADAGQKPQFRAAELEVLGVKPMEKLDDSALYSLIELETSGQPSEFWLGSQNFYVLTRYNRASFYAIAVIELGRALKQEMTKSSQAIRE
jgi:membrane-bound lytic murein transglycosylase B